MDGGSVAAPGTAGTAPAPRQSCAQSDYPLQAGQTRILEMVATGAPLPDTLDELIRFIEAQESGLRCGLLVTNENGKRFYLSSGPGLPGNYHDTLTGAAITPPYQGPCEQAAHLGEAVTVPNIAADTRWSADWRALVMSCGFAACRSTPVWGSRGRVLAWLAMYYDRPCEPQQARPEIIEIATHLAGIALERERNENALRRHQQRLKHGLAAARQLHGISTLLIRENEVDALYQRILGAALKLMDADAASIQIFDPESEQLRLLDWQGFHSASAAHWERVDAGSVTTCGQAMRTGERIAVDDFETCGYLAGTKDLDAYRWSGLRACQSTPLVARAGQPLGMISTHWRRPYQPPERQLQMLDVLSRQAADLLDRLRVEESQRREARAARAAEAHGKRLVQELSHRVKNTLATVQALARQTLASAPGLEAFQSVFTARLAALTHIHDLLMHSEWRGTALCELVSAELSPYRDDEMPRWTAEGPEVQLDAKGALALGMALHELATNAAEHGALSAPAGRVNLRWSTRRANDGEHLHLDWAERGGPPVSPPAGRGFGTRLIQQGLEHELEADVWLNYSAQGVCCTIDLLLQDPAFSGPLFL